MALHCHFVVGVDLDREVAFGVNEFDEERKVQSVGFDDFSPQQLVAISEDEVGETFALVDAVADDGFLTVDGTDFPTFAYGLVVGGESFERFEAMSAPHQFVEVVVEK